MRNLILVPLTSIVLLSACNSARKPNSANFTAAINQYLAQHGKVCTAFGRQFPIDIPRSGQKDSSDIGSKLTALEQAGLVHATDTMAVLHGMLDPLRGPTPPQPVRRYDLTSEGQTYFQQVPGVLGPASGFCYGQKTVESIIRWTTPSATESGSQAEVTYTYKLENLAAWAERSDVQQAFPDIRTTISGASKANQIVGLQLTERGWEVPGQ